MASTDKRRKERTNGIGLHGRQERAVYTEQYCG
nr:MAG TPA: hypothetical protein [Caudoviricetes sp.]